MKRNKKLILLVLMIMIVGFASASTIIYLNGSTIISTNLDEYQVYYSETRVGDGTNMPSKDNSIIVDDTHIAFTKEINLVGDKYIIEYDVTNGSRNYDAEVEVECTPSNDYLKITNTFNQDDVLAATETRTGKLEIELIKSYIGTDNETQKEVEVECMINANATERDTQGTGTPADKAQ